MPEYLPTATLIRDVRFQARCVMSSDTIEAYREWYLEHKHDDMGVLQVVKVGNDYFIVDGFHRHCAALEAGRETLLCDVTDGTLEDAIALAAKANETNGLHRTTGDKIRAVTLLLGLPAFQGKSQTALAKAAGVSRWIVAKAINIEETRREAAKVRVRPPETDDEPEVDSEDDELPEVNPPDQELLPIPQPPKKRPDDRVIPPKPFCHDVIAFIEEARGDLANLRSRFRVKRTSPTFNRLENYQPDLCRYLDNCIKILKANMPIGKCPECNGTGVVDSGVHCHKCKGSTYAAAADHSTPTSGESW